MTSTTPRHSRIVVGVDGSTSSMQALEWGARQAELTRGSLDVLTTWQWPTTYGWGMPLPATYNPADDAETILAQAIEPVRADHPAIDIRPRVVQCHPAPALVDASKGAALLVVGSRGHGEYLGMLLGSVSQHCVSNAHCPVLVFRETSPSTTATAPSRIVVGVDGAKSSVHALEWAARQAEMTGAMVEVVTTWEWPTSLGRGMPLSIAYEPATVTEAAIENVLSPVRSLHPALDLRSRVVEGHPAPILVEDSRGADLLVVGSRGHGEFTGMLLGSVSEHCASNAHCPVLVLRDEA